MVLRKSFKHTKRRLIFSVPLSPPISARRTFVTAVPLRFSTPTEMGKELGETEVPSAKGRQLTGTTRCRVASPWHIVMERKRDEMTVLSINCLQMYGGMPCNVIQKRDRFLKTG